MVLLDIVSVYLSTVGHVTGRRFKCMMCFAGQWLKVDAQSLHVILMPICGVIIAEHCSLFLSPTWKPQILNQVRLVLLSPVLKYIHCLITKYEICWGINYV